MHTVRGQFVRIGGLGVRRGFTLVEIIVTVLVTGVLVAVVITGVRGVAVAARDQASAVTVRSLGVGVRQFQQQFGFLPPLVHDGGPMTSPLPTRADGSVFGEFPVDRSLSSPVIAAYSGSRGDLFLRGYDPDTSARYDFDVADGVHPIADERYSKTSLAFYLIGALGADVDGEEGPGFKAPSADGVFRLGSASRSYEPFYAADQSSAASLEGEYFDPVEYEESGRGLTAPSSPAAITSAVTRDEQVLVDRNGKAYRYYRWESGDPNAGRGVPAIGSVIDQNIPSVLLDVEELVLAEQQFSSGQTVTADPTGGDPELRSARWAVVGAGADGLFGTEDETTLREVLDEPNLDLIKLRNLAREDNIVEVGG